MNTPKVVNGSYLPMGGRMACLIIGKFVTVFAVYRGGGPFFPHQHLPLFA